MNLHTVTALLLTAALSACTDQQINKTLAAITGELDHLTDEHAALKAELVAAQSHGSPATDAELDELRRQYAELALKLESVGYTPELLPEPVEPDPAPPVVETPTLEPAPPPFECVSIFRVQTCEEGVLYMLDDQMGWILPGRTE